MIAYVTPITDSASANRGRGMMKASRNIRTKLCSMAVLIAVVAALFICGTASATDIHVGPGETNTTIQGAVTAANVGDTIIVRDGTYPENVDVGKQLTIRSENGSANCIVIAASTDDHIFSVNADYVNISGFTVSGATGVAKAGICLDNGVDHSNIYDNTVSNNNYGIYLFSSSNNNLTNNTASFNNGSDSGYGIYLSSSSNNNLTNNTANSNTGYGASGTSGNPGDPGYGYGIFVSSSSNNNTLSGNIANSNAGYGGKGGSGYPGGSGYGYGINLSSSNNNTLSGNTANSNTGSGGAQGTSYSASNGYSYGYGHGISLFSSGDNNLTGNTANSNTGSGPGYSFSYGYGISLSSSSDNNTLSGNTASLNTASGSYWSRNYGYGIYLFSSDYNTLSGNTANSNIGSEDYGISLSSSDYSTLSDNNVTSNDYGIHQYYSSYSTLTDNIISGNTYNFWLKGNSDSHFNNQIDTTNLVDGKPIYYVRNAVDTVYDSSTNAGTFYVISGVNVTLKDLDLKTNYHGILLWNTTDSNIQNVNVSNNYDGIYLQSSSNNTLSGNNATSNYNGIDLYYNSNYNNLTSNNVTSNSYGIYLQSSSNNNNLTSNNVTSNTQRGIYLYSSDYNTLSDNNATSNSDGIYLQSSSNNTLSDNNVTSNTYGIHLYYSSYSTLTNNIMNENVYNFRLLGNSDIYFNNQIDITNLVNGKPVYYIRNAADTVYDSSTNAGTFYVISGVNVTLKDLDLKTNYHGILLWNTTDSNIQNVNVSDNYDGIYLQSSSNNTLSGNNATSNYNGIDLYYNSNYNNLTSNNANSNTQRGIYLYSSDYNTLSDNNASNNNYGISLSSSDYSTLSDNNVTSNSYGIYLQSSSINNNLTSNNANLNTQCGIYLYSSDYNTLSDNNVTSNSYGIYQYSSDQNTLSDNNASNNNYGIYLQSTSKLNTITNNIVSNNNNYGIYLQLTSDNNTISNNYFNNSNNAFDSGYNIWNTTKTAGTNIINGSWLGGNYWSDYVEADTNRDELGDTMTPYNSSSNIANGGDYHPLLYPETVAPILTFVSPTSSNNTKRLVANVEINVTITEADLINIKYNWNGTNFSMYNNSLVLMMNFDNVSALGEIYTRNVANGVVDVSECGNSGTLGNSTVGTDPTWISSGIYEGAFDFDGLDDSIIIPTTFGIGTTNLSITAWVNLDSTSEHGAFVKIGDSSDGFGIGVGGTTFEDSGNDLILLHELATNGWIDTNVVIGTGWHHVAMIVDGNENYTAFIDGVSIASGNVDGVKAPISDITYVGGYIANRHVDASLDEVRIFNRSLSADEIYQQYVSNLNKIDSDSWELYVNQSKNSTTGLIDGNYTYQVFANDFVGNSNQTEKRAITIALDVTAPVITITTPTSGSQANRSGGQELYVNFTYVEVNPKNYTIHIRNATDIINSTTAITTGTPKNVSLTMNATAADGNYNVTVTMWDNASYTNTSTEVNAVFMDSTPPTAPTNLIHTDDAPSGYDDDNSIDINWSVATDVSSSVIYLIYRDGVLNTSTTSLAYTFTNETDGSHTYNVSASDSVGNINTTNESVTVIVDDTNPVIHNVSLSDESPSYDQQIIVSVNVTDAHIANVTADGKNLTHQSGALWNGTITAGYGVNIVTVTAYDNFSKSATDSISYTGPDAPTDSGGSSGGGGVGTSDEPENVEETVFLRIYLQAGDSSTYNFDNLVTSVEVTPEKTYGLVGAKVEVLAGKPGSIATDLPAGEIYKYVNVFVGTSGWFEDKFSSSVINFQLPTSWFEENNIDPASVTLYRHHGDEWQPLTTTMTRQAGGYYQYSSPTPGFSTFVIMGQVEQSDTVEPVATTDSGTVSESTPTLETISEKGIPGFGILMGIMGILIAVYSRRK